MLFRSKMAVSPKSAFPGPRFFVSDEPEQFRTLGERFLGTAIASVAKVAEQYRRPGFDRRTKPNGKTGHTAVVEKTFAFQAEG